jgi:hypothetical protein
VAAAGVVVAAAVIAVTKLKVNLLGSSLNLLVFELPSFEAGCLISLSCTLKRTPNQLLDREYAEGGLHYLYSFSADIHSEYCD